MRLPAIKFALTSFILGVILSVSSAQEVNAQLKALEKQVMTTVELVKDSVIAIELMKDGQLAGSGSGVIVSEDGIIFTAAHVVDKNNFAEAILSDGTRHKIEILGMNLYKDAAICRMVDTSRKWPYAKIGDSDKSAVTTRVLAMGHGRGYDERRSAPVRFGRIRAHNPGRFFTTDCPLIGGDSGGPLFNLKGEVIGINSSINGLASFNVHAGVSGFMDDYDRMMKQERWGVLVPNVLFNPETPVIGIGWSSPQRNSPFNRADPRPIIDTVIEGGPAQKAGLLPGDMIVQVNDETVLTQNDVMIEIGRELPGETINMKVRRKNALVDAKVKLIARGKIDARLLIDAPRIEASDDSPFIRDSDKPKLAKQTAQLYKWAEPLAEKVGDTYIQLFWSKDITSPLLNATVIDDETAIAPLSAFLALPLDLLAWRPGADSFPVELVGGYEEHDLAVLKIPGLKAEHKVLSDTKKAELGEFLLAVSNKHNKRNIIRIGVVSVEERFLRALFGVAGSIDQKGNGALLTMVSRGEAAANMGLKRGDIVTKFNGKAISGFAELVDAIKGVRVGDEVSVEYTRNGETFNAKSIIGARNNDGGRIQMMDQLGDNSLSRNTDTFQTVIQSDLLVEPQECGAPIFNLDGSFIGIAISDAGRNKSYIIPAHIVNQSLQSEPKEINRAELAKQVRKPRPRDLGTQRGISPSDLEELRRLQDEQLERLFNDSNDDGSELLRELMKDFFGR